MLRLLTFGGLSLVDDGAPVTGAASQRSRLALLAILAAAGPAGVSRDKLLASLWPESEDERARHALKQSVYALRRDLGNENAIAGTATLTLDPNIVASDIREFEDALARGDDATAVSVYAGPFLDGVFVRGAAEFDQWAGSERTRLERAYLDAIERLAKAADAQGDLPGAVQWWRKAAAAEPVSGRYALLLMRALAEGGDVSSAIQHARVHEAVVRSELDSTPDDAVTSFAEELKRGDWKPTPRAPRSPSPGAAQPASAPVNASVEPTPAEEIPVTQVSPIATVPRKRSRLVVFSAGIATLLLVALAGALVRDQVGAPPPAPSNRTIVIAGFANHTGDPRLDAVGEYAADHIVKRLVDANFQVVDSRTSYAARSVFGLVKLATAYDSAAALAKETGAGTVITGKYYEQGDTLRFQANVVDPVRRLTLHAIGPVEGSAAASGKIVAALANELAVAMAASSDTNPGASTAALIPPPSIEAFVHASRAWEMFFSRPADTASAFSELKRALLIDSSYTTPRLMRAYMLDVKERWGDLAAEVQQLEPRRQRMGRVELAALALYDADLHGDLVGRLRASRELLKLSPGSIDMSLLVAVSASYLHQPNEVLDVLKKVNPRQGINILTPMYWAWRAEAEHALGRFDEELSSATELTRAFPSQLYGAQARARALAAKGDTAALYAHVKGLGFNGSTMTPDARTVALLGARELRAHGHGGAAPALFARVAAAPPSADADRDQLSKHALALYETANYPAAKAAYASLLASDPGDLDALGRLGSIALRTGDTASFRQVDARLRGWKAPYPLGKPTYWRAHHAALAGHPGEAIALMHQAISEGYRAMDLNIVTIHEEPDFISLWGTPPFNELLNGRSTAMTTR